MIADSCLVVENLAKSFHIHQLGKKISACSGINFSVGHGEFIGITGRSGSGKSTILKLIYRTYLPQQGAIRYDSAEFGPLDLCTADERTVISLRRKEIGYVSQFLHVIPRTTAREIVEHAVLEIGRSPDEARETATEMLRHFELSAELHDSYPATFSGGEKLRLNIARAMAKKPRLLLLDEPTASLDSHAKLRVRALIERLKADGTTMVGIFHDLEFMEGLCDRVFNMQSGSMADAHHQR
jgi:alpha-D-ribose 1-methylphosphonate 5-triphosphate synthase subunit PhnL